MEVTRNIQTRRRALKRDRGEDHVPGFFLSEAEVVRNNPMSVPFTDSNSGPSGATPMGRLSSRISVPEIARRLDIGRLAVYTMLEQGLLPGIRLGRRWIVTRHAFEIWERTCGMQTGLQGRPEHKVT